MVDRFRFHRGRVLARRAFEGDRSGDRVLMNRFELLDSLSIPGDPEKPNDDAFGISENAAVVLDGATSLCEPLLPGKSDAAWLAQFGTRRLLAHLNGGDAPREAVGDGLGDAGETFAALGPPAPAGGLEGPPP